MVNEVQKLQPFATAHTEPSPARPVSGACIACWQKWLLNGVLHASANNSIQSVCTVYIMTIIWYSTARHAVSDGLSARTIIRGEKILPLNVCTNENVNLFSSWHCTKIELQFSSFPHTAVAFTVLHTTCMRTPGYSYCTYIEPRMWQSRWRHTPQNVVKQTKQHRRELTGFVRLVRGCWTVWNGWRTLAEAAFNAQAIAVRQLAQFML